MALLEKKRIHAFVSGRVHGVGFRYFAQRSADYYNLTGWVKNCGDGRVEVVAEGEERILNEFIKSLEKGPSLSNVSSLDVEWMEPQGRYTCFNIAF